MFILTILDITNNKKFEKTYNNYYEYKKFINKVKYSKKLKIISIQDLSKWYD